MKLADIKTAVYIFSDLSDSQRVAVDKGLDLAYQAGLNDSVSNDPMNTVHEFWVLQYANGTYARDKHESELYSYKERTSGVADIMSARRYLVERHAENSANKHNLIAVPRRVRVVLGD